LIVTITTAKILYLGVSTVLLFACSRSVARMIILEWSYSNRLRIFLSLQSWLSACPKSIRFMKFVITTIFGSFAGIVVKYTFASIPLITLGIGIVS
jgi:hypothetical protein